MRVWRWNLDTTSLLGNAKFDDAIHSGKLKLVSRWMKGYTALPILDKEGTLVTHPKAIGQELSQAWQTIYNPVEMRSMTDPELDMMCEHMETVPWCPGQLTGEQLQSVAKGRHHSASGPDNISLRMLQKMPVSGWQLLAAVLNKIEDGQPWPEELLEVNMAAIPRPDAKDIAAPLKYRMISITSQVHRTWACLRAAQATRGWLVCISNDFTFAGLPGRSAKDASSLDALMWDKAAMEEKELHAAYLDTSKCFDMLKVEDLMGIATRLGFSSRVAGAMQQWYRGHSRSVLVRGWLQPGFRTSRGIPQGCPLSVLLCTVWNSTWSSHIPALLGGNPCDIWSCSTYMDDFAVMAPSTQQLQLALGFTVKHFELWQIQLNTAKSAVVSNVQVAQQEVGDLVLQPAQRLLGIDTGWFGSDETFGERLKVTKNRIDRMAMIPLSQKIYSRLVTTFLCPVLYGAEFADQAPELRRLDSKLKLGMWGRARCSANYAAIFAFSIPSHKATLQGSRAMQVARSIWAAASKDRTRRILLSLWRHWGAPRASGLWRAWLGWLQERELQLNVQGGALDSQGEEVLHLNQPRSSWLHQCRHLWRLLWLDSST